jgi:diaminopimelate epimerase
MASIAFSKWEGTGNDFILIDDRSGAFPKNAESLIQRLCDRHFGIGSDGLILLQAPRVAGTDYHMEFFNPDASQSFCGNGSRCAFAFHGTLPQGLPQGTLRSSDPQGPLRPSAPKGTLRSATFTAIDGKHQASWSNGLVGIGMRDVVGVERIDDRTDFIHTGSPHLLCWVDDPERIDIMTEAHKHRYGPRFAKDGVNVNFLRLADGRVEMRTYERGVEAETLSCGTGVTAAALSAMARGLVSEACDVHTRGGDLRVEAMATAAGGFSGIALSGPVREVFRGVMEI